MMTFAVGEKVVYPNQGVGMIENISTRCFEARPEKFYLLRLFCSSMTVMVPFSNAESIGLRRLSKTTDVTKVLAYLAGPSVENLVDWKLRFKINSDKIEIHLEGGGEGRRGSNHANRVGASYKRAGGSRLNLRYQKDLTDADIAPQNILRFMSRLLDVSRIELKIEEKDMPAELRNAIEAHTVIENMTYKMVLMSFGDPDQKKVDDVDAANLKETWFYLKNGHRWVVHFENGKVTKTQVF